jgi:hypothetical protein
MTVKPFELEQAQDLVRDAVSRSTRRHQRWRVLEMLYRTGSLLQAEQTEPGTISEFFPNLSDEVTNLILPHINIILSSVIARDPKLLCVPLSGGEQAEINKELSEGVISYFWKRARATRELRDATADSVKLGSGFLKVAWSHLEKEFELEDDERALRAVELEQAELILAEVEGRAPDDIDILPASVPSSEVRVVRSEPFVEYVSPYDVFVPVNARRMEDARWVVQRLTLPVDELLANPEFDLSEDDIIRDGTMVNRGDEYQAEWRRQTEEARGVYGSTLALDTATIWEFYDMRTRRMMVFQLDAAEPLWQGDIPWSHRYPPFIHVQNYSATGNDFWGFGDIENVASLQGMFNEFMHEQMENARRSGQKYLVRASVVSDELREALETSDSDVVAPVQIPVGEPLSDVIVPVFRQALAGDVYAAKAELEDKMRQVLGINDFQAGGVGADRMSATAAAVVDGVATLRAQDKIASVEDAASQVGNLILLLCQEYLDEPTAIRLANAEGAEWETLSKDDLYGEFLVSVEGGSTRSLNPATREQQGIRTLAEVVPILVQLGYDPEPALKSAMRDLGYDPAVMLVRAEQPAGIPGAEATGGGMSEGDLMAALGGPPAAAEAQAAGGLAL